jgi:probable addiction module antidote protein
MRKKVATAKKKVTLTRWDPVENLTSEEAIAAYLEAAMEEAGDDPAYIAAVLGDIAKARGILKLAEDTGMTRGGLYRALSPGGNPSFETILKVTKALGLKVTISKAA